MIKKETLQMYLVRLEKIHDGIPFGQAFYYVRTDSMKEANDIAKEEAEKEMASIGFPCIATIMDTAELNMVVLKQVHEG